MRLWTLLESDCHILDLKLAQHTTGQTGDRAGFLKYSTLIHDIQKLEENREKPRAFADMLDGVLTAIALEMENSETNPHVRVIHQEAVTARTQLDEMVN